MFPDQNNQTGGQPGYGSQPQQAPSGEYQVVPPLPVGQNNGHTGHNPYEFIVNPNTPKHSGFSLRGSFGKQIGLIVGGAAVLLIVAAVLLSALAPKGVMPELTAIAQRQQEIIRVATAATQQAGGQDTKNFVTTAELSVTSDQQLLLGYLVKHGTKLGGKTLAADASSQTDNLLASAANAGTYDSAVVSNLRDQLQTYETLVQNAYRQTGSSATKQVLRANYSTARQLLAQAQAMGGNQ